MNSKHFFSSQCIYNKVMGGALGLMAFLLLSGCATHRGVGTTTTIKEKDSIDVKVEYRTIYVTDTVTIEIPAQSAERTTQDSISHLENDYAESDARINPDGTLYHSLNTKPQKKPIEYQKPIEHRDSVRVEYRDKEVEKEIPVEVERDFTWWEKRCIGLFPYAIALILGLVGWIFRKHLLKIVKKLI